jgi:hypothetical protein
MSKFSLTLDTASDVVILTARLPGDYSDNGVVDAADYVVWRNTLGSTTDLRANGDDSGASHGKVDDADFIFWTSRFGMTPSPATSLLAVPEPASPILILVELQFVCTFWSARFRASNRER